MLGKAQRILAGLRDTADGPIHLHGAMAALTDAYRDAGIRMAPADRITDGMRGKTLARSLVLAPLSARGTPWMKRLPNASVAFASGLMRVRGVRRQRAFDRGFVLSDHVDWPALLGAIETTGAETVWVTHGYREQVVRYLTEQGLNARSIASHWEGENDETPAVADETAIA